MTTLLRAENLTKRFGRVVANDRLHLEITAAEVHGLLGENGAGKSTLMNILYGLVQPEEGKIFWKGREVSIASPREALDLGIGMVHQHFMLVASLTMLENVVLGTSSGLAGDLIAAERRLQALAKAFHQPIDPHALVGSLSVGEQQRVEIFKALYRDVQLLILDEPTASLTPGETTRLFEVCRALVEQGKSVIFITHKLDEVRALSDRVTVLRHGRNVATLPSKDAEPQQLARFMVGRDIELQIEKAAAKPGAVILEVSGLRVAGDRRGVAIKNLSLSVKAGEIVGIAGVDGNGQSELVEAILGLRRCVQGSIRLQGEDVTHMNLSRRMAKGLAILPGDRHTQALVQDFSLLDNALLGFSESPQVAKNGFLRRDAVTRFTQSIIMEFKVKAPSTGAAIRTLSGGHQQRFVFGRTLQHHASLLIAVQPTRGLDFASSDYVRRKLIELRDAGGAVLLISMDLDELRMLSDRIDVMHAGEILGTAGPRHSREEIGLMMAGVKPAPSTQLRPDENR